MTNSKEGGLFNQKQRKILELRARGFTQLETARKLGTSRANVSMIEWRARKKLDKARETVKAFEALQSSRTISVEKGTKLTEVPMIIQHQVDKYHIQIDSDIRQISRLVKALKPTVDREGKTISAFKFKINERGKVEVSG